jgi:hypothetical protein
MFGQNSIIFLCVGLGVFTLANIVFRLKQQYVPSICHIPAQVGQWFCYDGELTAQQVWQGSRK